MPTVVYVKIFPKHVVEVLEFAVLFFWTELRLFLVRQKYHTLEIHAISLVVV
jgi:hypothetical protein